MSVSCIISLFSYRGFRASLYEPEEPSSNPGVVDPAFREKVPTLSTATRPTSRTRGQCKITRESGGTPPPPPIGAGGPPPTYRDIGD